MSRLSPCSAAAGRADLAQHAEPRRDMAMRQRPLDPEPTFLSRPTAGRDRHAALQQPLQRMFPPFETNFSVFLIVDHRVAGLFGKIM